MIITAIATVAAGAVAWAATPFVVMARRGTLDDQARVAMREEAARAEAVRRARHREALVAAAAAVEIPEQRRGALAHS